MRQYEQDFLELGFRAAKAMHYQARWARSYQELAAIEAALERHHFDDSFDHGYGDA